MDPKFTVMFSVLLSGCALEAGNAGVDTEALGQSGSAVCRNALSPVEGKTVLKLIDDICGDTWCEGDNDFAFERLTCQAAATNSPNGGTCRLGLRIIPRDGGRRSYLRSCFTSGFFGFDSLVDTTQSGYQSLDWDYYLALTDCISQLEAELPR
jgi:hypothetical protein